MAPPSSVSLMMLPVELLHKLVRDHLPEWQDRRALRRTCRDFRALVDGVVAGATLDCRDLEWLTSGTSGSSSGLLLRRLKRLNVRGSACRDPEAVCWRFGALHLSTLTQLTRLELRYEDATAFSASSTMLPLLRLVTCAPASLRHLRLRFPGFLTPVDALPVFATLAARCRAVEKLVLQPRLAAESLPALAAHAWPQLRSLDVAMYRCEDVAELLALASLTQLTQLAVHHVEDEGVAAGLAALSELVGLRDLELEAVAGLDDTDGGETPHWLVDALAGVTALTRLVILPKLQPVIEDDYTDYDDDDDLRAQLPAAAFDALPDSLVQLSIGDTDVSNEGASALAALPRLASLTVASLALNVAAVPRFTALMRLEMTRGGIAVERDVGPTVAAAAAAFPALEWYSGELGGDFPSLPRLHTALVRPVDHTRRFLGGLAGLTRCAALRRLQLDDTEGLALMGARADVWQILPAVQSLKVGVRQSLADSYLDDSLLAGLAGSFPDLTALEFYVPRPFLEAPCHGQVGELAFAPLLALPRLASLHLYSMPPSLARAALAQLVAGAPALQRLALSFGLGGRRARPEVTQEFLAALARSTRQRAVRCELLSSSTRWETRW